MPYYFVRDESIADGLARITAEEISAAVDALEGSKTQQDEGIHEARKSIKKIRALVELAQPALGRDKERRKKRFRNIGRDLSELRDAGALLELVKQLARTFHAKSAAAISRGVASQKTELEERLDKEKVLRTAVKKLKASADKEQAWPLKNSFRSLEPALKAVYRAGRRSFRELDQQDRENNNQVVTSEAFHQFRKLVKTHLYQLRLLAECWTAELKTRERQLDDLQTWLGDDHNLVVLFASLHREPERFGGADAVNSFLAHAENYQAKLREKSLSLGRALYAPKPRAFANVLTEAWSAWRKQPSEASGHP